MDMHVTVKSDTGRTTYSADSCRFWHTNRKTFDDWCAEMNARDLGLTFEVREYDPKRKAAPKKMEDKWCEVAYR